MSATKDLANILGLTTEIVAAHVANNPVSMTDLSTLIQQVYRTLAGLGQPLPEVQPEPQRPEPAVPIRKSVTPGYLVCLEDGKHLKMLKRHLQTAYNMTPDEYRERWGLPKDYPMTAPDYAERRSSLAKSIGLGRKLGQKSKPRELPAQSTDSVVD